MDPSGSVVEPSKPSNPRQALPLCHVPLDESGSPPAPASPRARVYGGVSSGCRGNICSLHTETARQAALALIAAGINDCEIARRLGLPRTTIRDWRRPPYVAKAREACLRCWGLTRPV